MNVGEYSSIGLMVKKKYFSDFGQAKLAKTLFRRLGSNITFC